MKYTFDRQYCARTVSGRVVHIPDQVAADQHAYDRKSFPVRQVTKVGVPMGRAVLRGDLYGLGTHGTGDPVVSIY